jgi:uncharacterized membrane protein YjfL (UPF0719 family)
MYQSDRLIDEVRLAALLAGGIVALTTTDQRGPPPWWLYGLCVALILLGICGGAYFTRKGNQGRTFFVWSFWVLSISVTLCGLASYRSIELLDEVLATLSVVLLWVLIFLAVYWRIFRNPAQRHTGTVNTSVVASFSTGGALAGSSVFYLAPRELLMPILGTFISMAIGAAVLVLLMFRLKALIESGDNPTS